MWGCTDTEVATVLTVCLLNKKLIRQEKGEDVKYTLFEVLQIWALARISVDLYCILYKWLLSFK